MYSAGCCVHLGSALPLEHPSLGSPMFLKPGSFLAASSQAGSVGCEQEKEMLDDFGLNNGYLLVLPPFLD